MGNVFANGLEVSGKKTTNKSAPAMMSVCLSPPSPPAGPIPIPYPVTDMASNTTDGTGSVVINKKEVGKKNGSNYKKCNGNQPATRSFGMDVVSHTIQGKTKFEAYSFDVMFEKDGAERFLDLTSTNHMNPATAFTCSTATAGAPDGPSDDDCKALDQRNKDFREKNDEVVVKKANEKKGTDAVKFGESGTVTNGAFMPGGATSGTGMVGAAPTGKLPAVGQNLCQPTSDSITKEGNKAPSSYKFPFCPGNQYEHPAGGFQAHAELNVLNNVPQPTTSADRLLLNINWAHDGLTNDPNPCEKCQTALKAACECMTIYICTEQNEPRNVCEDGYEGLGSGVAPNPTGIAE